VCFHGVTAYGNFLRFAMGQPPRPALGPQAERLGAARISADLARWYDRLAAFATSGEEAGSGRPRNFRASEAECYHVSLDRKESRWNL
jgi:hypothetical protein